MALTEEQEKSLLDFQAKYAAIQTESKAAEDKSKSGEEAKSIVDQAKAQIEAEKAAGIALTHVEQSIKFNLSVNDFVEKNKTMLPEESGKILTAISAKSFKDDNEKANVVRKTLLDSFLAQQENLDALTGSMKSRATQYKALAESDKEKKSSEFWDLVEVGVALKAGVRKAEALNKINGVNAGDSTNVLESKILAAAREKFNNKK